MERINRIFLLAFIALLLVEIFIALCLSGTFIRFYVGDILVIPLIYCMLRIVLPPARLLPLFVFLFAVLVEVLQGLHLDKILGLTPGSIPAVILGSTFSWLDILCYGVGMLLILCFRWLGNRKA